MALAARTSAGLTASAGAVLRQLAQCGPTTRPALASDLGLSKPTVSAAVNDLEAMGLVAQVDVVQGTTGRAAAVYGMGRQAGFVLGVDIGVTRVRVMAADLQAKPIMVRERPRRSANRADVKAMATSAHLHVTAALQELGEATGPLRSVVVGVPNTVIRRHEGGGRTSGLQGVIEAQVRQAGVPEDIPVQVENNVNCAAVAEMTAGCAQDAQTFAVLQVGVGIGLAVVYRGELLLGANGAAGEPAYLPFPWMPGDPPDIHTGEALEKFLGAEQWMSRVAAGWPKADGPPPQEPQDLIRRAAEATAVGHAFAAEMVREHAQHIGRLAVAVSSIVDPGLIVLGGGVGSNSIFIGGLENQLQALPWKTEVRASTLGPIATAVGATQLAATTGLRTLLENVGL
jgi:predicted NBD/HSP70 family sugar kinase/biotin operon repressor